ncbi:MAG: toll/interleukin-1 receptor domain-containing protein [Anaerolineae bacterium]
MVSVYLTYRNDPSLALANLLAQFLQQNKIHVILSPKDKSGNYRDTFPQIDEADVFMCVVTNGTFAPRWIQMEVEHAFSVLKPMIPIFEGSYEPDLTTFPKSVKTLLEQEGVRISESDTMDSMKRMQAIVARIYEVSGKKPGEALMPNQYVFLSYSRQDNAVINRVRDDLRQHNIGVWIDVDGLEPGTPAWERAISQAIREAGCLVVLLSPDAEQSVWVGRELAMAEALNKRIFPILIRGSEQDAIPFRLMTHQRIDARDRYDDALPTLVESIRKHLGTNR